MILCLVIIIMIYHSIILKNSYQIMTVEYVTWRSVLPAKSVSLLPPATKFWQDYILTSIYHSVNTGGGLVWGVPGPGRVPGPGGCLVLGGAWSWGGAWSQGVPGLGGTWSGGVPGLGESAPGGSAPGGRLVQTPRRPLLRVVRILLECILV